MKAIRTYLQRSAGRRMIGALALLVIMLPVGVSAHSVGHEGTTQFSHRVSDFQTACPFLPVWQKVSESLSGDYERTDSSGIVAGRTLVGPPADLEIENSGQPEYETFFSEPAYCLNCAYLI